MKKNYPVKSVRKWFTEFTEYVAGCCNSHIYNLSCRILQYSISQFVLVSGSNSIKKACSRLFLPSPFHCNSRIVPVTFKESFGLFQVHPKNKWSCYSQFCAQCLCSIWSVPPKKQTRHVWGCFGGYTMMSPTGNIREDLALHKAGSSSMGSPAAL